MAAMRRTWAGGVAPVLGALLALALMLACCHAPRDPAPGETSSGVSPEAAVEAATPRVVLTTQAGRRAEYDVELARTETERQRGLMFREKLPRDRGMLFLFDREEIQVFWMRNTPIPLDMIFIGADWRVVGVVADARPYDDASRWVNAPSRYVLEVNAGEAARIGLTAGDRVEPENVPGL